MKNIFLIDGANGTGKSDLVEYVKNNYNRKKFISIITKYTTRLKRPEEENLELDLEFVEGNTFNELMTKDNFYDYRYGTKRYGFFKQQIDKELETVNNVFIVIRNKEVSEQIIKDFPLKRVISIFIYSDPEKVKLRLIKDNYSEEAMNYRINRINTSWEDYLKHSHVYSEVLINNSTKTDYHRLIDWIISKYNSSNDNIIEIDNRHSYQLIKPLVGFKNDIENALEKYPFEKNVFLMMKFRKTNFRIYKFIKETLYENGFNCIRADEPEVNITKNVYNPLAVIYICKYGIALFDDAEDGNIYSPNVSYELGMMQTQRKDCMILKKKSLPNMPFDIIKDLYIQYDDNLELKDLIIEWVKTIK